MCERIIKTFEQHNRYRCTYTCTAVVKNVLFIIISVICYYNQDYTTILYTLTICTCRRALEVCTVHCLFITNKIDGTWLQTRSMTRFEYLFGFCEMIIINVSAWNYNFRVYIRVYKYVILTVLINNSVWNIQILNIIILHISACLQRSNHIIIIVVGTVYTWSRVNIYV